MDQLIERNKKILLFLLFLLILVFLSFPVIFGILGTILPSMGYFLNVSDNFTFKYFFLTFQLPGIEKSIYLSISVGILSTFISLILSQAILAKLYFTNFFTKLNKLLYPLIAFPHITMAVGISFLFSSSGFFIRIISLVFNFDRPPNLDLFPDNYGLFLIFGLILKETPFFLLISIGFLNNIKSKEHFFLAKSKNFSDFTSWIFFIFPLIYKKLKITIFVVLIFSATVIDMSLILAPTTPSTLSIRILQLFQQPELASFSIASCLSIIQLLIIILIILTWISLEKLTCKQQYLVFYRYLLDRRNNFFENILYFVSITCFLIFIINIFISIIWSLAVDWNFPDLFPKKLTLDNYLVFFKFNFDSFFNSLILATLGSFISLIIIIIWSELLEALRLKNNFLNFIFYIPLLVPELTILLGFNFFLLTNNFDNKFLNVLWIKIIYIIPYTYLIFSSSYKNINKKYLKIAQSLNKSYLTILFKIKLNLMLNIIFLSFAIGFIISISLYAPIYFIGNGEITTLSLEIINLQTSGDRKDLAVATTLQMVIPLLILLIFHLKSKIFIKWSV